MLAKTVLAFAGLVASVSAVMVTSPAKGEKVDLSVPNDVAWTSVSSDPTSFSIVLVDQTTMASTVIAASASTADGKYTFSNIVAPAGSKYKINLLSLDPKNTGILAQSETFEIVASSSSKTSSSSAVSSTASGSSSTFTGFSNSTTTAADSSTDSATATTLSTSATGAAASKTSSAPATVSTNAAPSMDKTVVFLAGPVLAVLAMLF